MADVLFRYLLSKEQEAPSWRERLLLNEERATTDSLDRIVETAAVRLEIASQLGRVTNVAVTVPASKWNEITFVDAPVSRPPVAPNLENRTDRFPLRSSLKVIGCFQCDGTGRLSCKECQGRGVFRCKACDGRGYHTNLKLERVPCVECKGVGEGPCRKCDTKGVLVHDACGGEGRVATWQEERHVYTVHREGETFLPDNAPAAAASHVQAWLDAHPDQMLEPTPIAVAVEVGYTTPELDSIVRKALTHRDALERKTGSWDEQRLFATTVMRAVPMSACVAHGDRSAHPHSFWLIGRGERAVEIRPPPRLDSWKIAGLGGGVVALVAGVGALVGFHVRSIDLDHSNAALPAVLAVFAALGVAVIAAAAFQLLRRKEIPTIAVIPCSCEPTPYLACLTALGTSTRVLDVPDRAWTNQIHGYIREDRPLPLTRCVVVRHQEGGEVRLVEITGPDYLTHSEWARLAEAVQGILFIETPECSADDLREHMHAATELRPTELRLFIDLEETQCDRTGLSSRGTIALEGIRRALIEVASLRLDWIAMFNNLWGPLSAMVAERERPVDRLAAALPLRKAS